MGVRQQKKKSAKKREKPVKLNMPFDEAIRRIVRVDRDELDRDKETRPKSRRK